MSKNFPPPPPERRPSPGAAAPELKPESKSKEAEAKPKPKLRPKPPSDYPWRPTIRVVVSLLVVLHLTAVFSAPWYIQLRPIEGSNPAIEPGSVVRDANGRAIPLEELRPDEFPPQRPHVPRGLFEFFIHYNNLLYINNGYDFFSPNPAPSQLIRYWLYDSGGQEIASGMFPDRQEQWPRLFYHRHMMLAAQVAELGDAGLRSYARHLLRTHAAASRVHLELGVHHLLTPKAVLEGKPLDASDTYETIESIDEIAGPRTAAPSTGNGGQP